MRFYPPTNHVTDEGKLFLAIPCMRKRPKCQHIAHETPAVYLNCPKQRSSPPMVTQQRNHQPRWAPLSRLLEWTRGGKVPKCSRPGGFFAVQKPQGTSHFPSMFEIKLSDKCVQAPSVAATLWTFGARLIDVVGCGWMHRGRSPSLEALDHITEAVFSPNWAKINWTSGEYPFSLLPACLFSLRLHLSWACEDDKTRIPWAVFNTNGAVCTIRQRVFIKWMSVSGSLPLCVPVMNLSRVSSFPRPMTAGLGYSWLWPWAQEQSGTENEEVIEVKKYWNWLYNYRYFVMQNAQLTLWMPEGATLVAMCQFTW